MLKAVGIALWLDDEAQIDAVTAVSGSGPAYFFLLMEAMIAAGEKVRLQRQKLLARSHCKPHSVPHRWRAAASLIPPNCGAASLHRAAPPNAPLHILNNNVRTIVDDALQAASTRSQELSQQLA